MLRETMIALRVTLVTLILTGILYPLGMTGLAQLLFNDRANGSLIKDDAGRPIGSELIAQGFKSPGYFQGRVSAAGSEGFDALASGGSNLGMTTRKLKDRVDGDVQRLQKENPNAVGPVPLELVTASGSGLDPHISPGTVDWQIPRVADARKLTAAQEKRLKALVAAKTEGRDLGFLGEPRVNVLELNRALDRDFPTSPTGR
jgi:K+-transporting ATPase ATPase C chain